MNADRNKWLTYMDGASRSRRLAGRYVTITSKGDMAISAELTDQIPADCKYLVIEFNRDLRMMRLTPSRESKPGSLSMQRPTRKGRQIRIGTRVGLLEWGIVPRELTRYDAEVREGKIFLTLGTKEDRIDRIDRIDGTASVAASDERPATSDAPNAPSASTLQRTNAPKPKDSRPPRCCGNCAWQSFRLCKNQANEEKRNKQVSLDFVCDHHFYCLSLREPGEKSPIPIGEGHSFPPGKAQKPNNRVLAARTGSRPRARCPVADHGGKTFPVSDSGIMPHDVDGVVYSAGRGDRERKCPGSHQQPKMD